MDDSIPNEFCSWKLEQKVSPGGSAMTSSFAQSQLRSITFISSHVIVKTFVRDFHRVTDWQFSFGPFGMIVYLDQSEVLNMRRAGQLIPMRVLGTMRWCTKQIGFQLHLSVLVTRISAASILKFLLSITPLRKPGSHIFRGVFGRSGDLFARIW